MVSILVGVGVLIGLFSVFTFERKKEIARLSDSKIEDISFETVFSPIFANNAKGIAVVYVIKNNEWYSTAFWQPFSSEPILVWK